MVQDDRGIVGSQPGARARLVCKHVEPRTKAGYDQSAARLWGSLQSPIEQVVGFG
jgi:hypothetical protein